MLIDLDSLAALVEQCSDNPSVIRVAHSDCEQFCFVHLAADKSTPALYAVYQNGREIHRGYGTWDECGDSGDIVAEKIRANFNAPH